jgi:hypothetical protein
MYATLEITRPEGRIAAAIESSNGVLRVGFAESELLRESIERIIKHGVDTVIPHGSEQIEIRANPNDPSFLEDIARYFQLSFDFICIYKKVPELNASKFEPIPFPSQLQVFTLAEQLRWSEKQARELRPIIGIQETAETVYLNCSPHWTTVE